MKVIRKSQRKEQNSKQNISGNKMSKIGFFFKLNTEMQKLALKHDLKLE